MFTAVIGYVIEGLGMRLLMAGVDPGILEGELKLVRLYFMGESGKVMCE